MKKIYVFLTLLFIGIVSCQTPDKQDVYEADVVVYGGTSSAVIAAVQVARMGKTVMLISPDKHLGGMTSGGLGYTDVGNKEVVGGLAREFYHRIWSYYKDPESWRWQMQSEFGNKGQGTAAMDDEAGTMWLFEPHVAEAVFEGMIRENNIPVYREIFLDRKNGVNKTGNRIQTITTLSGKTFKGKVFIDATYEGDLMAAAGVSYTVGREANDVYGEQWNGVQYGVFHHGHYFKTDISPYKTPEDPASGLLPCISGDSIGKNGTGDSKIQAYCFRMCLTDNTDNRKPFPKPADYDPGQYELLARVLESGWNEVFQKFDAIPNAKTDTNNHGPFSTDNIGMNYDYPEASYERRRKIILEHEAYQKGLMYFLANDQVVPEKIRKEMNRWGLAKDEFMDNGNWPHQIYVREARRMIGGYVMTENDILGHREVPEPIGMGSYTMDSHNVQRIVTPEGFVQNEGDIGIHPHEPYTIAYGALTPKKKECSNLLVPVCLSSSHIAYGSIRMEPVFMILGQSAGTAAVQAVDDNCDVQDIRYDILQKQLSDDGQRLLR